MEVTTMKNNKLKTSFWNLIKKQKVVIPIIQRDYAQGRIGKEYLRQNFLRELKDVLDEKGNLTLDFVYGNKNTDDEMFPLDGQQRLTTLWLLHWYIAYKTGNLQSNKEILKKFSYETRVSSREFCEKLCELEPQDENKNNTLPLLIYIQRQTWFYSAWNQDPTIQSMLRMLCGSNNKDAKDERGIIDGIDELFGKCLDSLGRYWDRLTSEQSDECPITFYQMTIGQNEMPMTDDLYIKMNARGKALTSFENFKADLIKWIEENINTDEAIKYASLIDNAWTDVFWNNSTDDVKIDEIYFAFLNRYFLNYAIIKKEANEETKTWILYGNKSNDSHFQFLNFDIYKDFISIDLLAQLKMMFDNIKNYITYINNLLPSWANQNSKVFEFIPKYVDKTITTLTQPQRVLFLAVSKYFEKGIFDELSFKQWMRVACNLIENTSIETIDAMIGRLKLIDELGEYSHSIISYLASEDAKIKSDAAKDQLQEEIIKAKQIIAKEKYHNTIGPDEKTIIEAENYAFFHGAIRFLFTDENGTMDDWSNFDVKWKNSQKIFNLNGLQPNYKKGAKANRIILSYCDQWAEQIQSFTHNNKFIFGYSANSWLNNILLKNRLYAKPINKLLLDEDCNNKLTLLDSDKYREVAFRRLVQTNILECLQQNGNIDKYYVRWIYDGLCIYPSSEGVILTQENRDKVLNELIEKNEISLLHGEQINSTPKMFKGWYIEFVYKNKTFRWQHWNFIDMYDGDTRLCEKQPDKNLTINVNSHNEVNSDYVITELDRCIEAGKEFCNNTEK